MHANSFDLRDFSHFLYFSSPNSLYPRLLSGDLDGLLFAGRWRAAPTPKRKWRAEGAAVEPLSLNSRCRAAPRGWGSRGGSSGGVRSVSGGRWRGGGYGQRLAGSGTEEDQTWLQMGRGAKEGADGGERPALSGRRRVGVGWKAGHGQRVTQREHLPQSRRVR